MKIALIQLALNCNNTQSIKNINTQTSSSNFQSLTNDTFCKQNNPVSFSGRYDPPTKVLNEIAQALRGNIPNAKAPNYMPSEKIEDAIYRLLSSGESVSREVIEEIAEQKAAVETLYANLMKDPANYPIKVAENCILDAEIFLQELKEHISAVEDTLRTVGLEDTHIDLFNVIASKSATVLFNLGFSDAIPHATQVARRCAIEAKDMGADKTTILESAIVGWLHDPKVKDYKISTSNLATHPVLASALAHDILNQEKVKALIGKVIGGANTKKFIDSIKEALLINNDSKFVWKNVILNQQPFMPRSKEPGILDNASDAVRERLSNVLWGRFHANSLGETVRPVPGNLAKEIRKTEFTTGLAGIAPDGSIVHVKVNAMHLLPHDAEVKEGGMPALALAISDLLFLSPHKILMNDPGFDAISRIGGFIRSFTENLDTLPKGIKDNYKDWQFDVYRSIVKALQNLTGNQALEKLDDELKQIREIDSRINKVLEYINNESNWIATNGQNFAKIQDRNCIEYRQIYGALFDTYSDIIEDSANMLGIKS